jgi:[ribosomal protein S18]-alanine N-acetyltransferase
VYRLDYMTQDDVPEVSRVERRCFTNPWPTSAYRRELQNPKQNAYVVLRKIQTPTVAGQNGASNGATPTVAGAGPIKALPRRSLLPIGIGRKSERNGASGNPIVGFAGMWMAFDEAHITTIGIDPPHRGQGLGELLLICMVDEALTRGARWLTLEVRVSNVAAQTLYRKYGFTVHGTRKRYYSDNNEDALIMWSPSLREAAFHERVAKLRASLARRFAGRLERGAIDPFASVMTGSSAS